MCFLTKVLIKLQQFQRVDVIVKSAARVELKLGQVTLRSVIVLE